VTLLLACKEIADAGADIYGKAITGLPGSVEASQRLVERTIAMGKTKFCSRGQCGFEQ
jgi:hypothetical protein